jgi:hypothetical protein
LAVILREAKNPYTLDRVVQHTFNDHPVLRMNEAGDRDMRWALNG